MDKPIQDAMKKAASTALRDMRAEARKRIRQAKKLKASAIAKALVLLKPRKGEAMTFGVGVRGGTVRVSAYPFRQNAKGVAVSINRDKRTLIRHAFVATLKTGHVGVFLRAGKARFPIVEPLASRPVDALLRGDNAEQVQDRGARSFAATMERLTAPAIVEALPALGQRIVRG